jgi:hypothetical protein
MYCLIDITWHVLRGSVIFWPVFHRPGRQRKTRAAFCHPIDAELYGREVERRFRNMFAREVA